MGIFGRLIPGHVERPEVGRVIDFKTGYATVASARIIHVYNSDLVEAEVSWSTTSVYEVGHSYQIDLKPGVWKVVREDSW